MTVVLLVYSVLATWWAARASRKAKQAADALHLTLQSMDDEADKNATAGVEAEKKRAAAAVAAVVVVGERCHLCAGRGYITYERKMTHEEAPCPRCLGSGLQNKRHGLLWT